MKYGSCRKCYRRRRRVPYYVFPVKFFGIESRFTLSLCDKCRQEIEAILSAVGRISKSFCLVITKRWLHGQKTMITNE